MTRMQYDLTIIGGGSGGLLQMKRGGIVVISRTCMLRRMEQEPAL